MTEKLKEKRISKLCQGKVIETWKHTDQRYIEEYCLNVYTETNVLLYSNCIHFVKELLSDGNVLMVGDDKQSYLIYDAQNRIIESVLPYVDYCKPTKDKLSRNVKFYSVDGIIDEKKAAVCVAVETVYRKYCKDGTIIYAMQNTCRCKNCIKLIAPVKQNDVETADKEESFIGSIRKWLNLHDGTKIFVDTQIDKQLCDTEDKRMVANCVYKIITTKCSTSVHKVTQTISVEYYDCLDNLLCVQYTDEKHNKTNHCKFSTDITSDGVKVHKNEQTGTITVFDTHNNTYTRKASDGTILTFEKYLT